MVPRDGSGRIAEIVGAHFVHVGLTGEVLGAVTTVVEEVAEEYGANTARALARAKSYVGM